MDESGFDLDLRTVEDQIDADGTERDDSNVVLDVLDGTTPAEERIAAVEAGRVLVLAVDGDLNELASGFAPAVSEMDGNLVHFREFLIVSPPGVTVDTDRL